MKPYAELLEFNQPNPIRKPGFTRIRDSFTGLASEKYDVEGYKRCCEDDPILYDPERIIEFSGRWDYGENNARKLGETVKVVYEEDEGPQGIKSKQVPIIQKYIGMGHESMLEMGDATFFIECSRVVSHELVRHRIASFQQESQRFVKYDNVDDDVFYEPYDPDDDNDAAWSGEMADAYDEALRLYQRLREDGVPPQLARYVLPNAMRTRLIMKTNVREWRHICRLRLDKSAQPEMQELMVQIYDQLVDVFPNAMSGVLDNGRGVR